MLNVLKNQTMTPPPIWMMRQAGRYLPEYREIRKKAGSFLDLCNNPDFAYEITMQPIRRFDFDAAILFSDILVIPKALGRNLHFEEGRGPILDPLNVRDITTLQLHHTQENLGASFETLKLLKKNLDEKTTLIGFCGAPWTVATYMIAGHGTPDQAPARLFGFYHHDAMKELLNILAEVSALYLINQIKAGADCVQIFDSWSGVLDEFTFHMYCIEPVKRMVHLIRKSYPDIPIIGFPKGAGLFYQDYAQKTGVNALGLDWTIPLFFANKLQTTTSVQGNLDPLRLVAGGKALEEGVEKILKTLGKGPLIFNLGHGITPQTPIEHVEKMIAQVRNFKP